MAGPYESRATYTQRTQQIAEYFARQRAEREGREQQAEAPGGLRGAVGTAFGFLGRPLSATSSALASLTGAMEQAPGAAFMSGLKGESEFRSIEDVLKAKGVGELGGVDVGPFRVTGRGILGAAGSTVADPLTLATLPFGGGGSLLARGLRAAVPRAEAALARQPILGALAGTARASGQVPGAVRPIGQGVEEARTALFGQAPSSTEVARPAGIATRGVQAATHAPVIGGITRRIMEAISPQMVADTPIRQIKHSFEAVTASRDSWVQTGMAKIRAQGKAFKPDETGRITLTDGTSVAATDAIERAQFTALLTPEQMVVRTEGRALWEPAIDYFRSQIKKRGGDFNQALKDAELGPEDTFWPRLRIDEGMRPPRKPAALTKTGVEFERQFPTQETGIQAGVRYVPPVEAFEVKYGRLLDAIAREELAIALKPISVQQDTAFLQALQIVSKQLGDKRTAVTSLRGLIQRAKRGEALPHREVDKYTEVFPELATQLERALAVDTPSVQRAVRALSADVKHSLGIEAKELTQLLRTVLNRPNHTRRQLADMLRGYAKDEKNAVEMAEKIHLNAYKFATVERKQLLDDVWEASARQLDDIREGRWGIRLQQGAARAREAAKVAGREEPLYLPALKGQFFSSEEIRLLEKLKPPETTAIRGVLDVTQQVSALSRTMMASLDFAGGMIQLIPTLATRPDIWAKAQYLSFRTLLNPNRHAEFLAKPWVQEVMREMPTLQISAGGREFFAGVQRGGILTRIPGATKVFERPMAAFDMAGDVAKLYKAQGLLPQARRLGRIEELAESLNKATGTHVTAGLGSTQRTVEGSFLLFAPRYTRSALSLVMDALTRGDLAGAEARTNLASMMVAGPIMFMRGATALGMSDDEIQRRLDPTKSTFLTLPVGNDVVGIGSIWIAMARVLARSVADPQSTVDFGNRMTDNPIIQWWRSRSAPVGQALWDKLIVGEDYIGEPLDSPVQMGKYLVSKFLPFALEAYVIQGVGTDARRLGLQSLVPQLVGMRTFPQSRSQMRDTVAQRMFNQPYGELGPIEQAQVEKTPEVSSIPARMGRRGERQRELGAAYEIYGQELEQTAQLVQTNQVPKSYYRTFQHDAAMRLGVRLEDIPEGRVFEPRKPEEQSRQEYLDVLQTKDYLGNPNYEAAEEFLSGIPDTHVRYIEEKQRGALVRLPPSAGALSLELWDARKIAKPYWSVKEEVLKKYGVWQRWQQANLVERAAIEQEPRYKTAEKEWRVRREIQRLRSRELDKVLVDWYNRTPVWQQGR